MLLPFAGREGGLSEPGRPAARAFSTSGGIGKEADKLIRRMAERMSAKRGETDSSAVSFLRKIFRFDLLKTCIIALRGYKKPSNTPAKIETLDMDLRGIATSC